MTAETPGTPLTPEWLHENDIGCLWADPTGTMEVKACQPIWHEPDAAKLLDREREVRTRETADLRAVDWHEVMLDALTSSDSGNNPFYRDDDDTVSLAAELAEAVKARLR